MNLVCAPVAAGRFGRLYTSAPRIKHHRFGRLRQRVVDGQQSRSPVLMTGRQRGHTLPLALETHLSARGKVSYQWVKLNRRPAEKSHRPAGDSRILLAYLDPFDE